MYEGLKHAHSGIRWFVVIAILMAIYYAFFSTPNKKAALWSMILMHVQLVLGFILYFFVSPRTKNLSFDMKDAVQRFYGVEHISMMILSVILITIGYSAFKRNKFGLHKWMFLIGFIVLLFGIPWPFRFADVGWF